MSNPELHNDLRTEKAYANAVDEAFALHFPGFATLSPLDPVKLVAESVSGALAAVERRQQHVVEGVLEAMPALSGIVPKAGQLPTSLFRFRTSERITDAVSLEMSGRDTLRFQDGAEMVHLFPAAPVRVLPYAEERDMASGNERTIAVRSRGACADLLLQFVPSHRTGSPSAPIAMVGFELVVRGTSEERFAMRDLLLEDGTEGFSQFGDFRLRRRDGAPLLRGAGDLELRLRTQRPCEGTFSTNVFAMPTGRVLSDLLLGMLEGNPWEEIALPNELVGAPERIVVQFPDGRRQELQRLADEILRTRVTDPERFARGFFYDGTRHRVVLPAADLTKGSWNGAVRVLVTDAVCFPLLESLSAAAQPQLGAWAATLEQVVFLGTLTPRVARESAAAYLGRYYALLRRVPTRTAAQTLRTADLESLLLTEIPGLRAVELRSETSAAGRTVIAHCLTESPIATNAFRLEAPLAQRVRDTLGAVLPLDTQVRVAPFETTSVRLTAKLSLSVEEERIALLSETALQEALDGIVQGLLLPPPFGDALAGMRFDPSSLEERIGAALTESILQKGELLGVELTCQAADGSFLSAFTRNAGQCALPTTRVRTNVTVRRSMQVARFATKELVHA